jgi:hypothetical protein
LCVFRHNTLKENVSVPKGIDKELRTVATCFECVAHFEIIQLFQSEDTGNSSRDFCTYRLHGPGTRQYDYVANEISKLQTKIKKLLVFADEQLFT